MPQHKLRKYILVHHQTTCTCTLLPTVDVLKRISGIKSMQKIIEWEGSLAYLSEKYASAKSF